MRHDLRAPLSSYLPTGRPVGQLSGEEYDEDDRTHASAVLDDTVLLRTEAACRWLDIGRTKLFELIANGELATVKVGRSRRIPVRALRAYVSSLEAVR